MKYENKNIFGVLWKGHWNLMERNWNEWKSWRELNNIRVISGYKHSPCYSARNKGGNFANTTCQIIIIIINITPLTYSNRWRNSDSCESVSSFMCLAGDQILPLNECVHVCSFSSVQHIYIFAFADFTKTRQNKNKI